MSKKPDTKLRVGIFFGGKSAEHDVSLQSAKNVLDALDPNRYDPVLIGIDKAGAWHIKEAAGQLQATENKQVASATQASSLTLLPGKGELVDTISQQTIGKLDVALPILHGPFGEDGTIQGFLELAGIPYVGPGVLGSAVGMDKDVMKRLLRDAHIPIAPFRTISFFEKDAVKIEDIFEELGRPVFIKPANMGSSIGVSRAKTNEELRAAIELAFRYDTKIIIETAVDGDEVECAVLGNDAPQASVVGRIIPREGVFYSYEAKYIDENGAVLEIPAQLLEKISEAVRHLAIRTFQTLGCEGMGRVDMFVTKEGQVLVNEINTIPGFTKISMYPKLWEASGLSYSELITRLIDLAIERHDRRNKLSTS